MSSLLLPAPSSSPSYSRGDASRSPGEGLRGAAGDPQGGVLREAGGLRPHAAGAGLGSGPPFRPPRQPRCWDPWHRHSSVSANLESCQTEHDPGQLLLPALLSHVQVEQLHQKEQKDMQAGGALDGLGNIILGMRTEGQPW